MPVWSSTGFVHPVPQTQRFYRITALSLVEIPFFAGNHAGSRNSCRDSILHGVPIRQPVRCHTTRITPLKIQRRCPLPAIKRTQYRNILLCSSGNTGSITGSFRHHRRFWCRYLCPLGAIFGVFNKVSILKIRLDKSRCTGCKQCLSNCPANLKEPESIGTSSDCLLCGECINSCPTNALAISASLRV